MSTITDLKARFQTGDTPNEADYAALIDASLPASGLTTDEAVAAEAKLRGDGDATLQSGVDTLTTTTVDLATRLSTVETVTAAAGVGLESFVFGCSEETGLIGTGDVFTFRMPYSFTLVDIRASLTTAATSVVPNFVVKVNGTTISKTISIPLTKTTTGTVEGGTLLGANSPPYKVALDDEIKVNVGTAGNGAGEGLKVTLVGYHGNCDIVGAAANLSFPFTFPLTFIQYSISCS